MLGRLLRVALLLLVVLLAVLIYRLLFPVQTAESPREAAPAPTSPVNAPMAGYSPADDPQLQAIERYAGRASFVGDFARTTVLRIAMTECYMQDGQWPSDGCGVDLADLRGTLLETARIEAEGQIVLNFAAGKGLPAITVMLTPSVDTVGVRWHCSSPDYAEIGTLLNDCEFRGE